MQTALRYITSTVLGLLLAASILFGAHAFTMIAGAQQLDASDLLPSEFGDATGLGQADLEETTGNIIRIIIGFLGIVAVIIVLLGGFKWMTAGGNDDKVREAKQMLIAGVIGLVIVLTAYAITSFVISSILDATA